MEVIDEIKRILSENKKLKKKEQLLNSIIESKGMKHGLGKAFENNELKHDLVEACLHVKFLSDRLVHKYGENILCDYHIKAQAMGEKWKS